MSVLSSISVGIVVFSTVMTMFATAFGYFGLKREERQGLHWKESLAMIGAILFWWLLSPFIFYSVVRSQWWATHSFRIRWRP